MPQLATVLQEAKEKLEAVSETPRLDAEYLLAHELKISRSKLLSLLHQSTDINNFESLLERRLNHEPVPYIIGTWEFWGLEFICKAPILVPRPETEQLVETAISYIKNSADNQLTILDLCTGTGCIPISIADHFSSDKNIKLEIKALDINKLAVKLAEENAKKHSINIEFLTGDLYSALADTKYRFNLITANPPYVKDADWDTLSPVIRKHEDKNALLSGYDGLDCLKRVIKESKNHLKSGGMLIIEMDSEQNESVRTLFKKSGFQNIQSIHDLSGRPRIISGIFD